MAGRAARASTTTPSIHPKCSLSASDGATPPLTPKDPHVRLRLAPLPRGGERPPQCVAPRDGAVRPRRLALEARFAQIGGGVDAVGRSDRRLDSGRSEERRVGEEGRFRWAPYH